MRVNITRIFLLLFFAYSLTNQAVGQVFCEQNGLVIIEAESATITGDWYVGTTANTPTPTSDMDPPTPYSGGTYILYNEACGTQETTQSFRPCFQLEGNGGSGILEYKIKFNNTGRYHFVMRTWQPQIQPPQPHEPPSTAQNDLYFRPLDGDWVLFPTSEPDPVGAGEQLRMNRWHKSHQGNKSGWANRINKSGEPAKQYYLDVDEPGIYTIQLSGRSMLFAVDRLGFYHTTISDFNEFKKLSNGESPTSCQDIFFRDQDGDGFGDPGNTVFTPTSGYVSNSNDCDDTKASVNPTAPEICGNNIDENCDGFIDMGSVWYADTDSDGFGDAASSVMGCSQPAGYVADNTDCDDTDPNSNPAALEIEGDGKDNNCDGTTDEVNVLAGITLMDSDSDVPFAALTNGYVIALPSLPGCTWNIRADVKSPVGSVRFDLDGPVDRQRTESGAPYALFGDSNGDFTDWCPQVGNYTLEVIAYSGSGATGDIIGTLNISFSVSNVGCSPVDWFLDNDNDGYGDSDEKVTECDAPTGYVAIGGDCNDNNPNINPGMSEICGNGVDDDCDGTSVEGDTWYQDSDSDGYGNNAVSQVSCTQPAGYVADNTDCNDNNPNVNPGAAEICGNGIDDNCDGTANEGTMWYADTDNDGFGDNSVSQLACIQPANFVADNTDCDDTNDQTYPGAAEDGFDGIDNDCDGDVDETNSIATFTLMNADTDQPIIELTNGMEIALSEFPDCSFNVRANISPAVGSVGSVVFAMTGPETQNRVESGAPYALFGDAGGNYNNWCPTLGTYTLNAEGFTSGGGNGSSNGNLTVTFTVSPTPSSLPIVLSSFDASVEGNEVVLRWVTESELNNEMFELEKSADGYNFITFDQIPGAGTSTTAIAYEARDFAPYPRSFYRLKQVDFNGEFSYSNVTEVSLNQARLVLFPNPLDQDLITLRAENFASRNVSIRVANTLGQVIWNDRLSIQDVMYESQISTTGWPAGIYYFMVSSGDKPQVFKVEKF